jgi:hypothetical protein
MARCASSCSELFNQSYSRDKSALQQCAAWWPKFPVCLPPLGSNPTLPPNRFFREGVARPNRRRRPGVMRKSTAINVREIASTGHVAAGEPVSGPTKFQHELVVRGRVLEDDIRPRVFRMTQEISVGYELEPRPLNLLS